MKFEFRARRDGWNGDEETGAEAEEDKRISARSPVAALSTKDVII